MSESPNIYNRTHESYEKGIDPRTTKQAYETCQDLLFQQLTSTGDPRDTHHVAREMIDIVMQNPELTQLETLSEITDITATTMSTLQDFIQQEPMDMSLFALHQSYAQIHALALIEQVKLSKRP